MVPRLVHRCPLGNRTIDVGSIITREAIRRASFTSVKPVTDAIRTFIDAWNDRCVPFV